MTSLNHLLRCIQCQADLELGGPVFSCENCGYIFANHEGVPVMLPEASIDHQALKQGEGSLMNDHYMNAGKPSIIRSLRSVITSEFFPGREWKRAKSKVKPCRPLLIAGSGVSHYSGAVHMDLGPFPGVDIIGDATQLPFRNASFEGVISEVVLEHVYDARQVISETHRVLKPGGQCFFIVPFLFPFHGHPNDYRRWTREGLRAEFENFETIEIGIHGGPSSSLVNLLTEWCYIASGMKYPRGYTLIKGGATLLLFPLKFLDLLMVRFPEAHRLASTLFIHARKGATHV